MYGILYASSRPRWWAKLRKFWWVKIYFLGLSAIHFPLQWIYASISERSHRWSSWDVINIMHHVSRHRALWRSSSAHLVSESVRLFGGVYCSIHQSVFFSLVINFPNCSQLVHLKCSIKWPKREPHIRSFCLCFIDYLDPTLPLLIRKKSHFIFALRTFCMVLTVSWCTGWILLHRSTVTASISSDTNN